MSVFLTIAVVLGLTALFAFLNERFLGLQQSIGLMLIAVIFTVALALLDAAGFSGYFAREQAFVSSLALDDTLRTALDQELARPYREADRLSEVLDLVLRRLVMSFV